MRESRKDKTASVALKDYSRESEIRRDSAGPTINIFIGEPMLQVFDRMGCGSLILSTRGHVLAANAEARRVLLELFGLAEDGLDLIDDSGRDLIKRLIARSRTRIQLDGENWLLTTRASQRPLIVCPIPVPAASLAEQAPHTILILIDLDQTPHPHANALERIFGLTATEARLAVVLARGATVTEAAAAHKVSVATVRTQLAAIFSKTQTSRQAELVMLVLRLSALV